MSLNFDEMSICSQADGLKTTEALIKLGEEYGELCAAHLNAIGAPNMSASSKPNVQEEAVDVLICAYDYLRKAGLTEVGIQGMMDRKTIKWHLKIEAAKLK